MTKDELTQQRETVQKADHLLKRKSELNEEKAELLAMRFRLQNELSTGSFCSEKFTLRIQRHHERDIVINVSDETAIDLISKHVDKIDLDINDLELKFNEL